jgi:hypothetical protein
MTPTCLVIVWQKSDRTCSAGGVVQEKLVDCAGDASPTALLFLAAGLEVLKDKGKDDSVWRVLYSIAAAEP